ncbi:MAG: Na(+)-translocating NADH-quinone reductase subunit C [Gammaproteobacteria bacterium]|nr:Na(+)-translocating NADH-quinone reductase subunit C [Gammaproteobacteria bacterium]NNF59722.1 Na(+)-translocating NADH-quinone reductase subunit C [Gammaproteobacteria bacterium]
MPDSGNSIRQTLLVALSVSLVCSIIVATAAVLLEPRRIQNEQRAIRYDILDVAGKLDSAADIDEAFAAIETRLVQLETGDYADGDPQQFDARDAARDPELGIAVPPDLDVAQIDRRARFGKVYLVRDGATLERIVLPIHGYGLWSTMYGFVAVTPDAQRILAIKFYEHAETPGLGDQIDNPKWLASWTDTLIYDDSGAIAVEVIKGAVRPNDSRADYRIDGLSGATLTGNGVSNTVRYWLGQHGYGPYLQRLKSGNET